MVTAFESYILERRLFTKRDLLILAVSGGADSSALCELCHEAGYHFEIAHCNFQLRGEESDRDEMFVKLLGEKYGVACHVIHFDTHQYAESHKVSTQVAARELRYNWFDQLIRELENEKGRVFLVTAHHRDDSVETMLMNFFKGTGIAGLQGIPEENDYIRRPLLFATKDQLVCFLKERGLEFVQDSSNLTSHYTRNFFRNEIIPQIEKVFPQVRANLADNLIRFKDVKSIYDEAIRQKIKKLVVKEGNEIHIPVLRLLQQEAATTVLYETIKDYGFSSSMVGDVMKLTESGSGHFVASATHRIIRNRAWLILTPLSEKQSGHILIENLSTRVGYEGGVLTFEKREWNPENSISHDSYLAILDSKEIALPLMLRKWKQGDYFYPLGMSKKKKLSRFFIDNKLSIPEKERVWVIEQNKKILWVVGRRIDNRFRVTDSTKEVLVIKYRSH